VNTEQSTRIASGNVVWFQSQRTVAIICFYILFVCFRSVSDLFQKCYTHHDSRAWISTPRAWFYTNYINFIVRFSHPSFGMTMLQTTPSTLQTLWGLYTGVSTLCKLNSHSQELFCEKKDFLTKSKLIRA